MCDTQGERPVGKRQNIACKSDQGNEHIYFKDLQWKKIWEVTTEKVQEKQAAHSVEIKSRRLRCTKDR